MADGQGTTSCHTRTRNCCQNLTWQLKQNINLFVFKKKKKKEKKESKMFFNHSNRRTEGDKPFKCAMQGCDKSFFNKKHLRRHETLKHGRPPRSQLNQLFPKHSRRSDRSGANKPYKCPHDGCTKSFFNSNHLRRHETQKHGRLPRHRDPSALDQLLLSGFASMDSLQDGNVLFKSRRSQNDPDKPHHCQMVQMARRRTQIADKPHKCAFPGCSCAFLNSQSLRRHETQKHGRQPKFSKGYSPWPSDVMYQSDPYFDNGGTDPHDST
ncbi:hypothetical protein CAPTEDRAFT_224639 [Capitella teleta]|uniref:C2H2-type domain-containing protein n=1 Tax=Capitella teleta TaxID=283909 RepID=R7ULK3_CAPTE|nr:hypothetical protein CAPTEDRAFT_224639 [Capitella teleta]|eukprot:ELU06973.1 hypothetical protein CAPTEDRAFT_224639 [Capitella teleta]